MPIKIFLIYLITINLFSILLTVFDKRAAQKRKARIPEATLILFSILGGSIGMLFTMEIIRHKTKKLKFVLGIPLIIIIQAVLIVFWLKKCGIF